MNAINKLLVFEGEKKICEYKNLRIGNNKEDCVNQNKYNYQLFNLRLMDMYNDVYSNNTYCLIDIQKLTSKFKK